MLALRPQAQAVCRAVKYMPKKTTVSSFIAKRYYAKHVDVPLKADNPSFVLHGIEQTSFDQRPIPEVKDDQVLVQIAKTGICGSDIHYLQHGSIGKFALREPMCLGHESSGIVAKLGDKCVGDHLKKGTRIAIEPYSPCKSCYHCKTGLYHLCPTHSFAATPPSIYGTLCRYYVVPQDMCHVLPDSVSLEDGAMMEPLSVGVHAVSTLGQFKSNQVVVVFGAGPVGLLSMAVAKGLGARRVIAVDINQSSWDRLLILSFPFHLRLESAFISICLGRVWHRIQLRVVSKIREAP